MFCERCWRRSSSLSRRRRSARPAAVPSKPRSACASTRLTWRNKSADMTKPYMASAQDVKRGADLDGGMDYPPHEDRMPPMKRIWREALSAVTPYEAGKSLEAIEKELGLPSVRRLSANENPLGPSPRVIEALRAEAARAHLYPDGGSTALREAVGRHLGVSADWIIAGNGGDEILSIIARATFEPGDEIVMPHPSFEPYSIE